MQSQGMVYQTLHSLFDYIGFTKRNKEFPQKIIRMVEKGKLHKVMRLPRLASALLAMTLRCHAELGSESNQ